MQADRLTHLPEPTIARARPFHQHKLFPYLVLALLFFMITLVPILKPGIDIYDQRDEVNGHYPTVIMFADQFPHLDLLHYDTATPPLYHVALALATFVVGRDVIVLRLVSSLFSLACVLVVYTYLAGRGDMAHGLFFSSIFMLSPYFIGPAVRLSTDNVALLFAIAALLTLDRSVVPARRPWLSNVLALLAVLTRQLYIWLTAAYVLANFPFKKGAISLRELVKTLAPAAIPAAGLAVFLILWGGLTPPSNAYHSDQSLNLDVPVYVLSLVGLYGSLFVCWFRDLFRRHRPSILVIAVLCVLSAAYLLIHPVSNVYDDNRGGSLWLVVSHLPMLLSTSIVFWVLFPLGAVYLSMLLRHLYDRAEMLLLIGLPFWLIVNTAHTKVYQKYYEPFLLFFLAYIFVRIRAERWYYWIGPAALLSGFLAIAVLRFF